MTVAGVIVWVRFSGPIARALPASWSLPEWMAAATLRLDRWEAGSRIMTSASPQGWARMAGALELEQANRLCWTIVGRPPFGQENHSGAA